MATKTKQATKTTKETKAQEQTKAETTKPTTEVDRDRWGCKEGSQAAAINACIGTKPVAVEAIAKKTNLNTGRIRAHIKFLLGKELIVETDDGYKTAK